LQGGPFGEPAIVQTGTRADEAKAACRDDILRARTADIKLAREEAHAALERARSGTRAVEDMSPIVIERFTRTMREKLTTGEAPFPQGLPGVAP
jgi:hypothetical protein